MINLSVATHFRRPSPLSLRTEFQPETCGTLEILAKNWGVDRVNAFHPRRLLDVLCFVPTYTVGFHSLAPPSHEVFNLALRT